MDFHAANEVGCVKDTRIPQTEMAHMARVLVQCVSFIEDVLCFPTAMLGQTVTAEGPKYP